ncbi:O-antigen ligase family protein, partial [Marinobacter alexandrii]|uniref:O-antigen ligase family protein n=1 Tax=Marinobacter alexandrii TaxID=2570351 RepID=UPI0032983BEC
MDKLMMFSAGWAGLALAMYHPLGQVIEPIGIHTVEFFGAYMLGRVSIQSGADFRKFARVMFLIALVLFPLAALESVTGRPIALDLVPNSISHVNIGARWGLRRAQTFFSHPIHHGTFVSTVVGLAWFSFNYSSGFMGRVIRLGVVCVCTAFSMSSGALMAMVFQLIFIGWELVLRPHPKRWTIFAWLCVAGYVVVDLFSSRTPFHVVVNYATFSSGSAYNRILIWNYGTDNVWANPLFGLGLNDWIRPSYMSSSVDNFWLLIAMKYGLPASLAFMAAILLIVRRVSLAPLTDLVDRAGRAGYLVSLGGVVLAGATVHYWHGIGACVLFFMG